MAKINPILIKEVNDRIYRWGSWSYSKSPRRSLTKAMKRELDSRKRAAKAIAQVKKGRAPRSAELQAKIDAIKNTIKVRTSGNSTSNNVTSNKQGGSTTPQNNASANNSNNPSSNQANAKTNTGNQTTATTTAVAQNAPKNNPFYKSVSSWVTDNPKTSYSAIASLFAAPILYSMFGGSEDAPSGTAPKGTNADTNNYKLLANKAKQDINKEYAAAHNRTAGTNTVTNTQSATQNAGNNLKQLNELTTRIDANMAKLKALEAETLRRIKEQQANQKSPQNPQSGNIWDTSKDINNAVNENTQSSITPDYLTEFYKKFDKKYNYDPAKGRFNIWL